MAGKWPTTATDADLYIAVNELQNNLSGAVTNVQTTLPLNSATGFPTVGLVLIDNEVIKYTGISTNTLTGCTRAFDGTTAAAHSSSAVVSFAVMAAHHNVLKDEVEAIEADLANVIGTITAASVGATATSLYNRWQQLAQQIVNITGLATWTSAFTSLPIAKGGTNSVTSLVNNRPMVSSGGAILEGSALTAARVVSADANGLPTTAPTGTVSLSKPLAFVTTTDGIVGTTTNDNATAGNVGEFVTSSISTPTAFGGTTGQYADITSISLTAGDYDVAGLICFNLNGATIADCTGAVSQTTGNSGVGITNGSNQAENPPPTAAYNTSVAIPRYRVTTSSTVTVYLKANIAFSAGTPRVYGTITARRRR